MRVGLRRSMGLFVDMVVLIVMIVDEKMLLFVELLDPLFPSFRISSSLLIRPSLIIRIHTIICIAIFTASMFRSIRYVWRGWWGGGRGRIWLSPRFLLYFLLVSRHRRHHRLYFYLLSLHLLLLLASLPLLVFTLLLLVLQLTLEHVHS